MDVSMYDRGGPTPDEGVWGIRVVFQRSDRKGPAYLCHARDEAHAESIAGLLSSRLRHAGGYDIYRLSDRVDDASGLALGDAVELSDRRWDELFPGR
jgi:hypothetical protein